MDGQMDGWMDEWMDGWMDRRMDGQRDRWMNEPTGSLVEMRGCIKKWKIASNWSLGKRGVAVPISRNPNDLKLGR